LAAPGKANDNNPEGGIDMTWLDDCWLRRATGSAAALIVSFGIALAADPAPVPGFDDTTITVGELLPLTGPAANFGPAVANGAKAWFEYINKEKGGINGRYKIATAIEDNGNEQTMTVQSYNKIKSQVAMIAMLFGTHTTLAVAPQLVEDKLLASVEGADEQFFRMRNILPVGTTYQVIAINAIDYLVHERGAADKVFCGMIRDDPYGQASLAGVKFAAEKLHLKLPLITNFTLSDQDFSGQVGQLKGAGCDYIYATTIPPQLVRLVGNAVRVGYMPTIIVPFPSWTGALVGSPAMDFFEQHLIVAGEGNEWGDVSSPQMAQMIDNLKKYTPDQKPDFFYVLGYRCAMGSTEVLEKAAAAGDISREALLKTLETIKEMDFGGLGGLHRYGPVNERQPPHESSVFKANRQKPYGLQALKVNFTTPTVALYRQP
jgi:ABC-type branched-subunit amino acid transport system substrate-binding protein